ncbi:hypothetical protein LG409_02325 [Halomonas sp. NyZ770]|uniref:pilus assembly PilX family protein n=1 Tax=unclassified Halomonas TaxID=2609666 RepID=UPI0009BCA1E0|nr:MULTISPECIES: hypothetical protein [unclassified Halomonas]UDM07764.1 hypothetical protein LG409_02325 [Halomonas sp. NyZ770]
MNTQRGAALVIVMVLLASALVTAMMGMQSALVDERLAGNFRASLQAQMNSGSAAAHAVWRFDELSWEGAPQIEVPATVRFDDYLGNPLAYRVSQNCPSQGCLFVPVMFQGEPWVMALGAVLSENDGVVAQSEPVFVRLELHEDGQAAVVWK